MTGGVYDEACLTWSTEALSSLYLLDPLFFFIVAWKCVGGFG